MTMPTRPDLPTLAFPSAAAWEAWLVEHHAASPGVWVKIAKKDAGVPSVTYAQAVDVALCYGWIDGQVKSVDERYYAQRFTPRAARSKWSKINCGKVEQLTAALRMRPAGQRQVDAAKADGRWAAAYDSPRTATVPADLQAALDRNENAKAFFATLTKSNRYAILYRVQDAKRPETRARRIAEFVRMLAEGRTTSG